MSQRPQLRVTVRDDSGELVLRFLHFYPSQLKQFEVGRRVRAFGSVRGGLAGAAMVHPRVRALAEDAPLPPALTPIYPAPEGVPQGWLRKRIDRALRDVDIVEVLPARLLDRFGLAALEPSIGRLHHPPPDGVAHALAERTDPAWRRLKFDELLAHHALRAARDAREQRRAHPLQGSGELTTKLRNALPFRLTAAQDRAGF